MSVTSKTKKSVASSYSVQKIVARKHVSDNVQTRKAGEHGSDMKNETTPQSQADDIQKT